MFAIPASHLAPNVVSAGVAVIFGSTYDGSFEDIAAIDRMISECCAGPVLILRMPSPANAEYCMTSYDTVQYLWCAGRVNEANGWEVAIHVDAASGAFVAPFLVRVGALVVIGFA